MLEPQRTFFEVFIMLLALVPRQRRSQEQPTVDPADIRGLVPPDFSPSGACRTRGARVACRRFTPSRGAPHRGCGASMQVGTPAQSGLQWPSVKSPQRVTGTALAMAHIQPTNARAIVTTTWLAC
jgi:hypothetical protein